MKRGATWVVVILVLVAVGVGLVRPWWLQRQGRDDLAGCKESLNTLGTAIEAYSTHHGGLYPLDTGGGRGHGFFTTPLRLPQDIVPKYLNEMPTCPAAGTDTYSNSSWGTYSPCVYTLICGGHHHAGAGQGPSYPQYTSTQGLISQ